MRCTLTSICGAGLVISWAGSTAPLWAQPAAPSLVDVAWMQAHVCADDVVVIDVRNSVPNYQAGHIPCAVHTHYYEDGWRMWVDGIVNMLPPAAQLATLIGRLGVGNDSHVVLHGDGLGAFDVAEVARIYFAFRFVGHERVSILNGGLPAWTDDWENDIEVGIHEPTPTTYVPSPRPDIVVERDALLKAIEAGTPLVDMRSHDHFLGINAEPILARRGTIPGARNMPMTWMTVDAGAVFRSPENLRRLFAAAGVPTEGEVILFCNAGFESSVGWFAARVLLGNPHVRVYDGSLAEWSADPALPMESHVELDQGTKQELE